MARNSTGWFLPRSTASHETSYYSSPKMYRDETYYSDMKIVNHERNYSDSRNRSFEPILHPDTMEPMDPNKLRTISRAEQESKVFSRSKASVELRIDGSWSLGITMSSDGLVQKIHEGTPASRARLIFESRDGMWLAGQSKIIPGDTLVGICGNQLAAKGQAAYDLCHCTVGKSEVRLTFARNIQESIFQPSAQTYIVTLYRDPQPDLRSAQRIRHEYKYTEPANEYPPNSSTARISYSQPSHIYEPALERRSMVVRPSFSYEAPPVEAQTERFISGQLLSVQYVQGDSSHYTTFMPPAGTTREYTSAEWQERSYERGSAAAVFGEQSLNGAWTHVANGQSHPHEGHAHLQTDAGPHEPHSGVYVVRENEGNGRLVEHEQRVHRAAEPPPHETRTTSADHPGPLDRASQAAMLEALLDAAPEDPSVKPLPEPPGTPKAATAAQAKAARPNAAMAVQPKEAKRDSEAAIARNPGLPARSHSPPAAAPPRPPAAEPQGGRRGSLRELKSAGGPQGARRGMLQGLASGSFHGLPSSTEDTRRRGLPNTGSFRGLPGSPEPAVASPKIAAAAPGRAMAGRIAPPQQWLASDDEEDVGFDRAPLGHGNGDAGPVRGTGRGGPKPAPRPVAVSDDDGAM